MDNIFIIVQEVVKLHQIVIKYTIVAPSACTLLYSCCFAL